MAIRTRFTHRPRCFIPLVFVFAAISVLRISPARAQWQVVKSFGVEVRSVYFLDQQGAAATGFAGLASGAIWRTTDNGQKWNQMLTPNKSLQITDFAFSNTMMGWCSARRSDDSSGEIWKTTNGGLTWDSIYKGGAFVSIAYSPSSGILVAPCWSYTGDPSVQSTNSGATWNSFAPASHNGATFSGLNGVVGNFHDPTSLYSPNDGATWSAANGLDEEAWAPHGIPGTNIFVAATDYDSSIFLSTDGGASWTVRYTFPFSPPLTGCIMGTVAKMLFVQTEYHGCYFSSDTGKSWTSICGPKNSRDTRFYAIGKAIFAGDFNGNMWYTPDGTSNTNPVLGLEKMSISFSGVRCATYDSVLRFYYGAGCDTAVLTKAQILTGGVEFSTGAISLPQAFSGMDSLGILYTPSPSLHDTGTLLLEFNLAGRVVDTTIHLYGTGQSSSSLTHVDSLVMSNPYACMTGDTSIVIHNLSCDTLTLFRATIDNPPMFQLSPLKLPIKIAPRDSIVISVIATGGQDGSFHTFLKITTLTSGGILTTDSISIAFNILQGAEALFSKFDLPVLDACHPVDTGFSISATPCDSIVILSATLSDTSILHLGALTFPFSIKAAGEMNLPVHITPGAKGTDQTLLHLRYVSGQTIIDTTITLTAQVLYNVPLHVDLADSAFDLGSAGVPCVTASRWITFHNGLCRDLTIDRISWVSANSPFSFDPISLPDMLAIDTGMGAVHDVDSILVHFSPTLAGTESDQLRVTLDMNGIQFDTVLTISGTGVQAFRDTLLTPALAYDSIAECLSSEQDGALLDLSCDSIVATSASIGGNQGFSVIGPIFPAALQYGDTLRVQFQLQPIQIGLASDEAIVTLHDFRNDSNYADTIALTGFALAGRHALSLSNSNFSVPSIAPCSVLDSFLVVTNRGCDNVIIKDTTLTGYPGIRLLSGVSLPLTIAPDSSIRIPFRIVPNRDSLESTLLSLQGQNIDTSINFTYAALPGSPALTLSVPDSVFATRPCEPVSKTFWIANTGCDSLIIDSLVLIRYLGEDQFSLPGISSLPVILSPGDSEFVTITFDPNQSGDEQSKLMISARNAGFARTIDLSGTVIGTVPTARTALEAADGSNQCSGTVNNLTSVVAKLLDDIGDSTQLTTVAITLHANWDLLTPWSFSPATGWSVLDTSTLPDGDFQIRIHHDVAGAVLAGTPLVITSFYITVSDSTACDIGLTGIRFNDTSANYEDCVLSSIAMPDGVHFTEMDTCGTPELRGLMENRLALKIISVIPNPASVEGDVARINVTFDLARAGNVGIMVRDELGRECFHTVQPFTSGVQTASLQVPGVSEGMYFIQLESDGQTAEAKAIVQNAGAISAK